MTTDYQRTRARVVRAGATTAHLSIPAWCGGQILVPVSTLALVAATGRTCLELPGTEVVVTADLAAATEADVNAHVFRLASASNAWRDSGMHLPAAA